MRSSFRPKPFVSPLRLALGCLVLTAISAMTGCGGSPRAAVIEPAKNLYVIQNNNTNGVEADTVLAISTTATGATAPASTLQLPSTIVAFAVATGPDGEIYVGGAISESAGEVLVYEAGASGAATPAATLIGGGTGTFTSPLYLTVDSKGQLYVFSGDGSIESFAKGATTAASPVRYLTYPITTNDYFSGIGVDDAGEIFVTDEEDGIIDVFSPGANGATAPTRSISTSSTGNFTQLTGLVVDGAGDVTVMNYNAADDPFGDVAAKPALIRPHRLMARPRNDSLQVTTSILTFPAGAAGTATPTRVLTGSLTAINEPEGVAIDGLANLYYEDYEGGAPTLMIFPPAAIGNVAPKASITSTAFTTSYFGAIAAF
jgi:hypothetical protein